MSYHGPSLLGGGHASPYSLLDAHSQQPARFHLMDVSFPQFAASAPPPQLSFAQLLPNQPSLPGMSLVTRPAVDLAKMVRSDFHVPSAVKTVGVAASAFHTAEKLVEGYDSAIDRGESTSEAVTCQGLKILTTEMLGHAAKGFLAGGTAGYLAAAAASAAAGNPALAFTVPVVAPLIPQALQGAAMTAAVAGNVAEAACHFGFDKAREMSQGSAPK